MTTLDPIAFGQAAARATLNQDRRPFRVLTRHDVPATGGDAHKFPKQLHIAYIGNSCPRSLGARRSTSPETSNTSATGSRSSKNH